MTPAGRRLLSFAAQGVLLATAAGVLLFLGSRLFIGYDSYWHVFIARQDRWSHFWGELFANAHPPLFFLLLRTSADWFGSNLIAYRLVSMVATVAALPLVGAVVARTTGNRALALVAMAAYGFSYSVLTIGVEVRSYAVCAAFTLAAYVFYLDWLRTPGYRLSVSTHAGFALATTAAVLSHYSTFFFIGASIATPVILAIVSRGWRRRIGVKVAARPAATALMFGLPIAVAAVLYYVHVVEWGGGRLNHVADYMYTAGRETPLGFLLTNTGRLAGTLVSGGREFTPVFSDRNQWIALTILGAVCVAGLARLGSARTPRLAAVTVLLFAVQVALNAVAGLAGRYPFGGTLRHEFFLMAFAAVAFFSLFDAAQRGLPRVFRLVAPAAASCGVLTSIAMWTSTFTLVSEPIFQAQMDKFRQVVVSPQAVVVDAFTFINFYMHHHDWMWELDGEWNDQPLRQVWRLSRGASQLKLCRDIQWSFDMSMPMTYSSLKECLVKSRSGRVALLRMQWNLQTPSWDTSKTTALATTLSDQVDMKPLVVQESGGDVYAEFAFACSGPPPPPAEFRVVSTTGRVVVLTWTHTASPRVSAVLQAGRAPGLSDVLHSELGRTTTYTHKDVVPATYYARVRSRNACGTGAASGELVIVVE